MPKIPNPLPSHSADLGEWVAPMSATPSGSQPIPISTSNLTPVSHRPPLIDYIQRLWQRRYFIMSDAHGRSKRSMRSSSWSLVWLLLSPFLNAMVYYLVFGLLLQTSRGIDNFPAYLVVGLNLFGVLRTSLTTGSGVMNMRASQNLIRSFAFPRASIVLSWTIRQFLDFIPVFAATIVFLLIIPPHVIPTWHWLLVPIVLFFGFLFVFGLVLFTSFITSLVPHMRYLWPLVGRFWFYVSGIFFSIQMFDPLPSVKTIMEVNPAYVYLSMSRDLLIYRTVPSWDTWVYMAGWAFLFTALGFILFWSREDRYGEAN